jgi:hypothetical protein
LPISASNAPDENQRRINETACETLFSHAVFLSHGFLSHDPAAIRAARAIDSTIDSSTAPTIKRS